MSNTHRYLKCYLSIFFTTDINELVTKHSRYAISICFGLDALFPRIYRSTRQRVPHDSNKSRQGRDNVSKEIRETAKYQGRKIVIFISCESF
jgi:hypothetical protein